MPAKPSQALKELYDRNTAFLRDSFVTLAEGGEATARYPRLLSRGRRHDHVLQPGRLAPGLRPHADARAFLDDDHPAGPVRKLPDRAAAADHAQPRRAGHRLGIGDADPAAFRLPRRHPCRRRRSPTASSGRMRDLFDVPDLDGTDDHIANGTFEADPRRAAAAGAVHRAAHRLFAAPAVALHGDQPAAFPELRAVHQLPVLHRRVLRLRARADGQGRRRLHRLRRARQRHHAGRRDAAAAKARRRRACRRCRPIT